MAICNITSGIPSFGAAASQGAKLASGSLRRDRIEITLMPKLTVKIDPDIDFGVVAWAEAFGFQAAFGFRRKKKVNEGSQITSNEVTLEIPSSDNEELPE